MALTTSDQAGLLLSRSVAADRRRGAMSPDAEAIAVFESIALNLLLKPRSALWFFFLAKNGLQQAVQSEIAAISALQSTVTDLGNLSVSVTDTTNLNSARLSLLQMEQLNRISTANVQFKKFDSSISNFLNVDVAKGVKRPGVTSLVRPGTQAAADLPTSFTSLVDLHTDFLDRLYALRVGIDNFSASPLATIIGLTTVARARSDIEDIISSIESVGSLPADQDMVIRVLTNRASLKVIGNLPKILDPVIDTVKQLPTSYVLKARSDLATASVRSLSGPFALGAAASVTITVNGTAVGPVSFPQSTFDLGNKAAIASAAVTYPVVVPANQYLFPVVDGVTYKVGPFTAASDSFAAFKADLDAQIAAVPALNGVLHSAEFISAGTNRILLYHDTATTLSLAPTYIAADTELVGGVEATSTVGASYTNSLHALIGFTGLEAGTSGVTPRDFAVDALNTLFSSIVTATANDSEQFTVQTVSQAIGTTMTITAPSALGIAGTYKASSPFLTFYGTVVGVPTDPVSVIGIADIGDTTKTTTGAGTIIGITATKVQLDTSIPTCDGDVTVTSTLVDTYQEFFGVLSTYLNQWLAGPFAVDLSKLSLAVSSLRSGSPQSQRNVVVDALNDLNARLQSLLTLLSDPSGMIPSVSASNEKNIVDGITTTLEERRYDKALDLFLRCKIQEALDSTSDTASYGGALLKAASDFARTDMIVPNRALDESVEGTSSQEIKGL